MLSFLYLAIISIQQLKALQLTKSVEVPCPNETVRYECTATDAALVRWRVFPSAQPQSFREGVFIRNDDLNSFMVLSLPSNGPTVKLIYTMRTSNTIVTVAEFMATPEFLGMEFKCSTASSAVTSVLHSIASELTYIHSLNFRLYQNSSESVLELTWNEPVRSDVINIVDFYNLTVNGVPIDTNISRATVILPPNEANITVMLSAGNCLGATPTTSFDLQLIAIDGSEDGFVTTSMDRSVSDSGQDNIATEQASTCSETSSINSLTDVSVPTFVAAVVGACIGSSCATSVFCCLILMVVFKCKAGRNQRDTQTPQPVYEEISIPNDKEMSIQYNDAYHK